MKNVRRMRGCLVTAGILSMVVMMAGCATQNQTDLKNTEKSQEIIIGSDDYPPFNYADENGQPTGIDVELAKEAFGRLGYQAVFRQINWEEKKKLVESGQIDCIWGSFTMNGRENEYKWAGPYMVSRQVVAVNESSDIYSLQDLEGKRVAVQSTTKPEELFRNYKDSHLPKVQEIFSLQNRELIYPFLSKGYADAVAAHETAILQYMKDYDLKYRILEEPLLTVGLGVAFDKDDERGINESLSEVFEEMRADGTSERIIGEYLENAGQYLEVGDYAK